MASRASISLEALFTLQRRLSPLPLRSRERRVIIQQTADLYGITEHTLYRALREQTKPHSVRRADYGHPRVLPKTEMKQFCELIAAIKIRTSNKKGRHLSTPEAIRLLEQYGIDTPNGHIQPSSGLLKKTTINRYLRKWGYDLATLGRQPPVVRFQAQHSNDCWQFDMSPSDLKKIKKPSWVREGKGTPTLMLYSVVDDRSGLAYQEYHCVYGEDAETGLRFLFNAMAQKKDERFPFQGIPQMLYVDSGPVTRSQVFQQVMCYLGVDVRTHLPKGKDGRRVTARAKGKVERPFRTVKEMHETLYHFHEPETEEEANAWLMNFLLRYNDMQHRTESHSRMEDWLHNLPEDGFQAMCTWERFCTFAREPEHRTVGADARVTVDGILYEIHPDLAGEKVVLWWGLFDQELYVEYGENRYGPFEPIGGVIPLHRYRRFKKSKIEQRADRIEVLAKQISLPRSALEQVQDLSEPSTEANLQTKPFVDPDPFQELTYHSSIAAKLAIADYLSLPLAKLSEDQLNALNAILAKTLNKHEVMDYVQSHIKPQLRK